MATSAPALASASEIPAPIPESPPVTSARLPRNDSLKDAVIRSYEPLTLKATDIHAHMEIDTGDRQANLLVSNRKRNARRLLWREPERLEQLRIIVLDL